MANWAFTLKLENGGKIQKPQQRSFPAEPGKVSGGLCDIADLWSKDAKPGDVFTISIRRDR